MSSPTREQVYQAFCNRYYDEYKTLDGVRDEWEWFIDPRLTCSILAAGRGGRRCKAPCVYCRNRLIRTQNEETV